MNAKKNLVLLSLASFSLFFVLITLGQKHFHVWDQVNHIFDNFILTPNEFMAFFESSDHPHRLRFTLMYPIIYLSNVHELNSDEVFSYLAIVSILFFKFWFIKSLQGRKAAVFLLAAIYFIVLDLLLFKMNGRFIFPLLVLPCFYLNLIFLKKHTQSVLSNFIFASFCLIFSSISSGTFTVVFISYMGSEIIRWIKNNFEIENTLIAPVLIFYFFSKTQYIFVEKNLSFYKGDFWGLMGHGLGKFIPHFSLEGRVTKAILLLFILAAAFLALQLIKMLSEFQLTALWTLIITALVSLMGISTMAVCIVALASACLAAIGSTSYNKILRFRI